MNSTSHPAVPRYGPRTAADDGRSPAGWCHCGFPLVRCGDCGDVRCLSCDPYTSDDCFR